MSKVFVVCINLICMSMAMARPADVRSMAGWHKAFAENKKHLSPFEGLVFSKNVEKYYRFGKITVLRKVADIEEDSAKKKELLQKALVIKKTLEEKLSEAIKKQDNQEVQGLTAQVAKANKKVIQLQSEHDRAVVKGITEGDANIKLMYYLFTDLGAEFSVADAPSKIAHYLDAKAIGKIIACMDKACEEKNTAYIKLPEALFNARNTFQQLTAELVLAKKKPLSREKDPLEQALATKAMLEKKLSEAIEKQDNKGAQRFKDQVAKANERIKTLQMAGGEKEAQGSAIKALERRIYQAQVSLKEAMKEAGLERFPDATAEQVMLETLSGEGRGASKEQAQQEARELAQIIIDALRESGDLPGEQGESQQAVPTTTTTTTASTTTSQPSRYLLHMPFSTILSFLYEKVKSIQDLETYAKELPPSYWQQFDAMMYDRSRFIAALRQHVQAQIWEKDLDDTLDSYLKKSAIQDSEKLLTLNQFYEEICLEGSLRSNVLPPFLKNYSATVQGCGFTACGEATVFNWIQLLLAKLGLYHHATQSFDGPAIFDTMKTWFEKKAVSFDEEQLRKQTRVITDFFSRYKTAADLQSEDATKAWTTIVTNQPGVKYLRRKKEGESEIKDNKHPAVHPLENVDSKTEYGDYAIPLDDSFVLYELPAYPSGFVRLTNMLLGTPCKDFASLCAFFDITSSEDLSLISDQKAFEGQQCTVTTIIDNKPVYLKISFSEGHGAIDNLMQNQDRMFSSVIEFLCSHYDQGPVVRNILSSSFSPLQQGMLADVVDSKRFQSELQDYNNRRNVIDEQLQAVERQLEKNPREQALVDEQRRLGDEYNVLGTTYPSPVKRYLDLIPVRFKCASDSLGEQFTTPLRRHLLFSHDLLDEELLMGILKSIATGIKFPPLVVDPDYLFAHVIQRRQEDIAYAQKRQQPPEQIAKQTERLATVQQWREKFKSKK